MDEKLSKALEFANYTRTFEDQKKIIKEKYFDSLVHYTYGGQFSVTQTLITFVNIISSKAETAILIDDNNNPIKIDDLNKFYEDIVDLYFQASNIYYTELHEMKSKRSIEKLVEYE